MIEAAVLETARGRWFLVEYDRRRRAAETNQLLEAVIRLERALGTGGEPALMVPAKQAALPRPASPPLPDASPIASGCKDVAWNMRERRFDDAICAAIEEQARLVRGLAEPGWLNISALPPEASADPRLEALSRIDRMPLSEKLALFV